jgi:hypothetical protein
MGQFNHKETLAERTARRERELSKKYVKIDLLKAEALFDIPDKVIDLLYSNERKIDYIKEIRERGRPSDTNRFPVGQTMVLDTDKLIEDINRVKSDFIDHPIDGITTTCMNTRLECIFENFLNYHGTYIKYI